MRFSKMLDREIGDFSLLEIMVIALVVMVLYLVYKSYKNNFGRMGNMPVLTGANMNINLTQEQKDKMKRCTNATTWTNDCLPAFPKPK